MAQKEWIGINEQPRSLADWIKQLLQSLNIRIREGKSMKYADIMAEAMSDAIAQQADASATMFKEAKDAIDDALEATKEMTADNAQYLEATVGSIEDVAESMNELKSGMLMLKDNAQSIEDKKNLREIEIELTEGIGKCANFVNGVDKIVESVKQNENAVAQKFEGAIIFKIPSYEQAELGTKDSYVVFEPAVTAGMPMFVREDFRSLEEFEKSEVYQRIAKENDCLSDLSLSHISINEGHQNAIVFANAFDNLKGGCVSRMEEFTTKVNEMREERENEKGMERF